MQGEGEIVTGPTRWCAILLPLLTLAGCAAAEDGGNGGWPAGTEGMIFDSGGHRVTAWIPPVPNAPARRMVSIRLPSGTSMVVVADPRPFDPSAADPQPLRPEHLVVRVRITAGPHRGREVLVSRFQLSAGDKYPGWIVVGFAAVVLALLIAAVVRAVLEGRDGTTQRRRRQRVPNHHAAPRPPRENHEAWIAWLAARNAQSAGVR
jgi:hypothetical protein